MSTEREIVSLIWKEINKEVPNNPYSKYVLNGDFTLHQNIYGKSNKTKGIFLENSSILKRNLREQYKL